MSLEFAIVAHILWESFNVGPLDKNLPGMVQQIMAAKRKFTEWPRFVETREQRRPGARP